MKRKNTMNNMPVKRKPEWLKVKSNTGSVNTEVTEMLRSLNLHTVCEEASCPNCGECFGNKTATFMILGNNCTRNCRFCNVGNGIPSEIDHSEPQHIAEAVKKLGLRHVVITSVTRDDLPDGGSSHFADVIESIKKYLKDEPPVIEVLIPDFSGDFSALETVINAKPDIINHNIETIPRLYAAVRPQAIYERSLTLLKKVHETNPEIVTKSGIMLGLGESSDEIYEVLRNLRNSGCMLLTIGQYLAPSKLHHPVIDYIHPDIFEEYKKQAYTLGFKYVASGPLVRSSYMAHIAYAEIYK
ncbi:MAG: lipoyl synthase [Eubacteriales bacterium]